MEKTQCNFPKLLSVKTATGKAGGSKAPMAPPVWDCLTTAFNEKLMKP